MLKRERHAELTGGFIGRGVMLLAVLAAVALAGCDDDDPVAPIVVPDVSGIWLGQYNVTRCTLNNATDPFFCSEVFFPGASLVFEMELNQDGVFVSGPAFLGSFSGEVDGRVDEVGVVTLGGTIGAGQDARSDIIDWETILVGNDSLLGEWRFRIRDNTGSGFGSATVTADILLVDESVPTFFNCPMEEQLARDDGLLGALTVRDCQLDDFSYFDVYALDVSAGDQILISMSSGAYEPFLFVSDLNEGEIASDGEVGRGDVAVAIEATFAETWLIVANSLFADQVGDYSLSVERLAPAAATTTSGVTLMAAPRERVKADLVKIKAGAAFATMPEDARAALRRQLTRPPRLGGTGR